MNPAKLGKLENHDQEPWKTPLREYIQHLYLMRFGRSRPDGVISIEDRLRAEEQQKEEKEEEEEEEARRAARRYTASRTLPFGVMSLPLRLPGDLRRPPLGNTAEQLVGLMAQGREQTKGLTGANSQAPGSRASPARGPGSSGSSTSPFPLRADGPA
jgi:hypothetical protein